MKDSNKRRLCFHATEKEYWSKIDFARSNRREMTPAEKALWKQIRKQQIDGHRFRRQHIITKYIVDFVCLKKRLIVEVDGGYHHEGDQPERDEKRRAELLEKGFDMIRFTNEQVLGDMPSVLKALRARLNGTTES